MIGVRRVAVDPSTRRLIFDIVRVRGCSLVGRAPALQAGGRRFESVQLHHLHKGPRYNIGPFIVFAFNYVTANFHSRCEIQ